MPPCLTPFPIPKYVDSIGFAIGHKSAVDYRLPICKQLNSKHFWRWFAVHY